MKVRKKLNLTFKNTGLESSHTHPSGNVKKELGARFSGQGWRLDDIVIGRGNIVQKLFRCFAITLTLIQCYF